MSYESLRSHMIQFHQEDITSYEKWRAGEETSVERYLNALTQVHHYYHRPQVHHFSNTPHTHEWMK